MTDSPTVVRGATRTRSAVWGHVWVASVSVPPATRAPDARLGCKTSLQVCRHSVVAPSCWHRSVLSLQVSLSLAIHVRGAQAITVALMNPDSLHHAHTRVRACKPSLVDSSGTARCNCADMSCSPGGSCLDGMCGCFNGYTGIFCDRKVVLCITSSLSWSHPCCACSHMLLCTMMRARPCGTHLR